MLIEIRWHGRGGQGAWTASNLVAMAAALGGKHVQSFPAFGPERSGAPMLSFTRISDTPIEIHSMIYNPDILVVLDYTLLSPSILQGLKPEGVVVTNYPGKRDFVYEKLGAKNKDLKMVLVPASKLALEILRANITNTAMIGGLLHIKGLLRWEDVEKAVRQRFSPNIASKNLELIKKSFESSEVIGL